MDLFYQAKYAPARRALEDYVWKNCQVNTSAECANAAFFIARCALELYHKDAEFLMEEFIRNHPDSPNKERAYFEMGIFYGKKKSMKDKQKRTFWFDEKWETL